MMLMLLGLVSSALAQRLDGKLVSVSGGTLIAGIGGVGGSTTCDRVFNLDCSTLPRQLIGAVDFATDPTGRHVFVATTGLDYIGECPTQKGYPKWCRNASTIGVHDNSSRLLHFDLHTRAEPVTLSFCGPWHQVKYDAKRQQVIALRHASTPEPGHPTQQIAEVVAFAANAAPASDVRATECNNAPPIGGGNATCACPAGLDPANMNGNVIGRAGLLKDGIAPALTMTLLDDQVLVGDQNNYCVVAFPLDGTSGTATRGKPVAGTCGHSCGRQGCASIGTPPVKAGKELGDGIYGSGLRYELFNSPDGRLFLHDMNTETIDYGKAPKAETNYLTVPVDPGPSSVYFKPTFEPGSGDLLVQEAFTKDGFLLKEDGKGGYGNGRRAVDHKKKLGGTYVEASIFFPEKNETVTGIPMQWTFLQKGKLLVLTSFALPTGSAYLDHAFVELDIK